MSNQPSSIQNTNLTSSSSGDSTVFVDASVREALLGLKNGQITIIVHNGEIVQIDRILKKRQFKSRSHG